MHIFFATDGSASARFAQAQILALPWPPPVHVTVMMAMDGPRAPPRSVVSGSPASAKPRELTYEPYYDDLAWPDPV